MPVYDYMCPSCGPFTAMRPMSEWDSSLDCAACGTQSPRVLLTAPSLAAMSTERRLAHATNERSSHAPKSLSELKRMHGPACGCCSPRSKRTVKRGKGGAKSFPASRPWMISH